MNNLKLGLGIIFAGGLYEKERVARTYSRTTSTDRATRMPDAG
jgi:hypothetical protein